MRGMMEQSGRARVAESEAAQWRLQQCERHKADCSNTIAVEGQHILAAEVASSSRGIQTNQYVSFWVAFSVAYFSATKLQCNS